MNCLEDIVFDNSVHNSWESLLQSGIDGRVHMNQGKKEQSAGEFKKAYERENAENQAEKRIKIIRYIYLGVQVACFIVLWSPKFITGIINVFVAIAYLFLSSICLYKLDVGSSVLSHGLFMVIKVILAKHIVGNNVWLVLIIVILMSGINSFFRTMIYHIVDKYGLYWYYPLGMM